MKAITKIIIGGILMQFIIEDSYEQMSETATHLLFGKMVNDRRVNLSITAGNSPKKIYEILAPLVKNKNYLSNVHYYSFDEVPLKNEPVGMTEGLLREQFFTPAGIPESNTHFVSPDNYQSYDEEIEAVGGLDAMLIGIGADGHFCGNMPGSTKFENFTYQVTVSPEYPWYTSLVNDLGEKAPASFVTMGPASIMRVKHLILIANGKHKAAIIKKALEGPVDPAIPSSILKLHPNLTVILDRDAASLLR